MCERHGRSRLIIEFAIAPSCEELNQQSMLSRAECREVASALEVSGWSNGGESHAAIVHNDASPRVAWL
jgi:hypothetical protein